MPSKEIEEFARKLVQAVRDPAVRASDTNLGTGSRTLSARRWQSASADPEETARVVVPDAIDEALFAFLTAIDRGVLQLQYVADNGRVVDLGVEGKGELAGWYVAPDGWRHRYAQQRFFDFIE